MHTSGYIRYVRQVKKARMLLQLWLVSTDYDNWALVCTTSVSLGEGHPVQVRTVT